MKFYDKIISFKTKYVDGFTADDVTEFLRKYCANITIDAFLREFDEGNYKYTHIDNDAVIDPCDVYSIMLKLEMTNHLR